MIDTVKLIEEISNAPGISGFEDEVLKVGRKYGEPFANMSEDSVRNLYFNRKKNTGGKPVVLIDGHSDEVGFMVKAITPNGMLEFITIGGWVPTNVPAHQVLVRNRDGEYVPGVVGTIPPHYLTQEQRDAKVDINSMFIDVGATSSDEIVNDYKIDIAAPVVLDVKFTYDEKHDIMMGKAFDCRVGCASVIKTLEGIEEKNLKVDVVGSFSSQEEVGTRGAKVVAETVKPDIAIVFEGCPADDTFSPEYAIQTGLKRGPMLRHIDVSMITNPRFQKFALDLAKEKNIPVQSAVRSGGGTNGGPIHLSGNGVPTIVIGVPVRYIHTHYGYATTYDFNAGVELACEIISKLDEDIIKSF